VKTLKEEKLQLSNLVEVALNCIAPSPTYALFLQEKYILFLLQALAEGRPHDFKTPASFLEAYSSSNKEDKKLLCELYQHEMIMFNNRKWNPNLFVGYIQLRSFTSYMSNQVGWGHAQNLVEKNEQDFNLQVRGEHGGTLIVLGIHWQFMESPERNACPLETWQEAISQCQHIIDSIRMEALLQCQRRWCNVLDLASLGNTADVCVGSKVYNI
jgi:hypothetical protein